MDVIGQHLDILDADWFILGIITEENGHLPSLIPNSFQIRSKFVPNSFQFHSIFGSIWNSYFQLSRNIGFLKMLFHAVNRR